MRAPQEPAGFFSPDRFVPRGACGDWEPWVGQLYAISHLGITAAYVAIPMVLLLAMLEKRPACPVAETSARARLVTRVTYALFILFCGIGHLDGWLAFVWPAYHLFALWHAATALVSWFAVGVTVWMRAKLIVGV